MDINGSMKTIQQVAGTQKHYYRQLIYSPMSRLSNKYDAFEICGTPPQHNRKNRESLINVVAFNLLTDILHNKLSSSFPEVLRSELINLKEIC